jgi:hypothetical protein
MVRRPAWTYHATEARKAGAAIDQVREETERLRAARRNGDAERTPAEGGTA